MAIPKPIRKNFQTMLDAASKDRLVLLECQDADTKKPRYVICAVNRNGDGGYEFVPFGHLVSDRNPFDAYIPPEEMSDPAYR